MARALTHELAVLREAWLTPAPANAAADASERALTRLVCSDVVTDS
jgi:hypothetical protein